MPGMPGGGAQYSVMSRPQDPRTSMFSSSLNLNGKRAYPCRTALPCNSIHQSTRVLLMCWTACGRQRLSGQLKSSCTSKEQCIFFRPVSYIFSSFFAKIRLGICFIKMLTFTKIYKQRKVFIAVNLIV